MAESSASSPAQEEREHLQYWGYLFKPNKCAGEKLERLLKGIASCISKELYPHDSDDLKPAQLAAFYRRVGGQYDLLFVDMPPQSIAFIYKSLGCLHSLQPDPSTDQAGAYSAPSIPALKPQGFVTWQTIQLLLGPEEHVPFIQNALREFGVRDPVDGSLFPKILPKESFPSRPDPVMVSWHQHVSERLRDEAQKESYQLNSAPSMDLSSHRPGSPTGSTDGTTASGDERIDAAHYFSNPFYKGRDGKPAIVRTFAKAPSRVMQGGKVVVHTAGNIGKNIVNPFLWSGGSNSTPTEHGHPHHHERRRRSTPDVGDHKSSPSGIPQRHHTTHLHSRNYSASPSTSQTRATRAERSQPSRPRRRVSSSSSSSASTADPRDARKTSMPPRNRMRRHRSQDEPSPRGYFDDWEEMQRPRRATTAQRSPMSPAAHYVNPHPVAADPSPSRSKSARYPSGRSPREPFGPKPAVRISPATPVQKFPTAGPSGPFQPGSYVPAARTRPTQSPVDSDQSRHQAQQQRRHSFQDGIPDAGRTDTGLADQRRGRTQNYDFVPSASPPFAATVAQANSMGKSVPRNIAPLSGFHHAPTSTTGASRPASGIASGSVGPSDATAGQKASQRPRFVESLGVPNAGASRGRPTGGLSQQGSADRQAYPGADDDIEAQPPTRVARGGPQSQPQPQKMGTAAVEGVKGRRYAAEAPWVCKQ